jgi:hypothetical protein
LKFCCKQGKLKFHSHSSLGELAVFKDKFLSKVDRHHPRWEPLGLGDLNWWVPEWSQQLVLHLLLGHQHAWGMPEVLRYFLPVRSCPDPFLVIVKFYSTGKIFSKLSC